MSRSPVDDTLEEYRKAVDRLRQLAPDLASGFPRDIPSPAEFFGPNAQPAAPRQQRPAAPAEPRARRFKRGQGGVRRRFNTWWVRYHLNGRRIEERTDARTEAEARQILNERLGDVAKGVTPAAASRVRVRELYEDLRADYRDKKQHLPTLRDRWKHLEPAFANAFVRNIGHAQLRRYVDIRREEGGADQTIKNEIAVLRRMLRLGFENKKVAQLPPFPTISVSNTRKVFFQDEDIERLLTALRGQIAEGRDVGNGWLVPYVIVTRWIGTRRTELLTLKRRQLDLVAGKITIDADDTKNGEARTVYLPAAALEALRTWDETTRALERDRGIIVRPVFHRHGAPVKAFPYDLWHAACDQAGLSGRFIHDFRRTAARTYRQAGVPEDVTMKVLGHKTRSMLTRYDIKTEADLRDAAAAIDAAQLGQVAQKSVVEPGRTGTGRAEVVPIAPPTRKS